MIFLSTDHAGIKLKQELVDFLLEKKLEVQDLGPFSEESSDYPDFAQLLCRHVLHSPNSLGVLICGSGIGMSIAANRFKGIRAALVWNEDTARLSRQHNNANVLVLPARFITSDEAKKLLETWLSFEFEGGRHERRVQKIESGLPNS